MSPEEARRELDEEASIATARALSDGDLPTAHAVLAMSGKALRLVEHGRLSPLAFHLLGGLATRRQEGWAEADCKAEHVRLHDGKPEWAGAWDSAMIDLRRHGVHPYGA